MTWHKQGLIYAPDGSHWWMRTYTHLPTALVMDDVVRVYFAGLDDTQYGRIGFLDLNRHNLSEVVYVHDEPILDLGEPGCFDDSGVNPSAILYVEGVYYLYYIGWQRCERVPYLLQAGLAKSIDGVHFERVSRATILPRTDAEPFFRSAMTVIQHENRYMAWYPSAVGWETIKQTLYPVYVVRHTTSTDGFHWESHNTISINFQNADEFGFGRPFVRYHNGEFQMWYSIRSRTAPYRMGYATSPDGINWQRHDDSVGITVSDQGWDSEMICYGVVHHIDGKDFMFYNGNQHGKTGFGYAIREA